MDYNRCIVYTFIYDIFCLPKDTLRGRVVSKGDTNNFKCNFKRLFRCEEVFFYCSTNRKED